MADAPDAVKPMACCVYCGHFATVHHGGGGGKPGGSSCASPGCECRCFVQGSGARVLVDEDYLRPAEAAQLIEVSVHTLSYWRQSGRGPKPTKVGSRVLYQRKEIERWLATLDGYFSSRETGSKGWSVEARQTTSAWLEKAIEAAGRIEPTHTSPWKLASTYALLSIAESLAGARQSTPWPVACLARSSVCGMGHHSDDECQEPDSCTYGPLCRNEVAQMSRDVEAGEYAIDDPVIVGPGLPPEDGSCGQFAVQFHVTTTTVVGLKRIADARGVTGAACASRSRDPARRWCVQIPLPTKPIFEKVAAPEVLLTPSSRSAARGFRYAITGMRSRTLHDINCRSISLVPVRPTAAGLA